MLRLKITDFQLDHDIAMQLSMIKKQINKKARWPLIQ